jgi:hypothetical protein
MSFNERMQVAARFRMQRRFTQRPTPRALDTQHAEVDRRRIPLEGLRRTAAWWREQERIDFEHECRQRQMERSLAYFAERARETAITPTASFNIFVIRIEVNSNCTPTITGDTRRSAYGN